MQQAVRDAIYHAYGKITTVRDDELFDRPIPELGLDSHNFSELIFHLEDALGIEFAADTIDAIIAAPTLGDIAGIVGAARATDA